MIDREDEARQLVDLFRVDLIYPIGDSQQVKDFPKKFPHLISPFHRDSVFVKDERWRSYANALDISNAISHWHSKPEWKRLKDEGLCAYHWHQDDPLSDIFLMQFGAYPSVQEIGVDYAEMIAQIAEPTTYELQPQAPLPADILKHHNFATIGRLGIRRHYTVRPGRDAPGFFVGSASDPDDIVCFWNLRAADITLWFVDPAHKDRYADLIPELGSSLQSMVEHRRHEHDRRLGLWSRKAADAVADHFGDMQLTHYYARDGFWFWGSVSPPVMLLGEASTLGVVGESYGVPRVNFALANKPFDGDLNFHTQHLVASISLIGGLYGDEQNTFDVPYVPELNEFYARVMHFGYDKFRIDPAGMGLIVDAAAHDTFLQAMPVGTLMERIFSLAGFDANLSNSGRIVRQLLAQLGGLQGVRAFKIPGARQLLKKFGPRDTFTRETARDTIVDKTPEHPRGTFSAHTDLFLGPRPHNTQLTPPDVFSYMVEKGLFRIGVDLNCSKCGMSSWVALDALKQRAACELCGHSYDATRQLLDSKWRFRRSGVLGAERNAQGAIPVALTLQQLDANLGGGTRDSVYSASLDLRPMAEFAFTLPKCEVDFVWLIKGQYPDRAAVILAECKDQGPIKLEDFQRDLENMRRVADALPKHRFVTYVMFVKLAPFTPDEIALARTLNSKHQRRVILLTARELEPYHIFERLKKEYGVSSYCGSPQELANVTAELYFNDATGGSSLPP